MRRCSVVLVLDDQAMTRDLVGAMLEHDEIEVHTAPDGPTAVSMAEQLRPDVVLLDVMMPGEDGFDVCRTLRSSEHQPRVVMLTGRSDAAARAAAAEAGAEAYLVKPFSAFDLFRLVLGEEARGA